MNRLIVASLVLVLSFAFAQSDRADDVRGLFNGLQQSGETFRELWPATPETARDLHRFRFPSAGVHPMCQIVTPSPGYYCDPITGEVKPAGGDGWVATDQGVHPICTIVTPAHGFYCDPATGELRPIESEASPTPRVHPLCGVILLPPGAVCDPETGEVTADRRYAGSLGLESVHPMCTLVMLAPGAFCDPVTGEIMDADSAWDVSGGVLAVADLMSQVEAFCISWRLTEAPMERASLMLIGHMVFLAWAEQHLGSGRNEQLSEVAATLNALFGSQAEELAHVLAVGHGVSRRGAPTELTVQSQPDAHQRWKAEFDQNNRDFYDNVRADPSPANVYRSTLEWGQRHYDNTAEYIEYLKDDITNF